MPACHLFARRNHHLVCTACQWYCRIPEGFVGLCGVRAARRGKLFLLTYGYAAAAAIDPMEKKPLYHFLPGQPIFSLGTLGCNFGCEFCQNWDISQTIKIRKSQWLAAGKRESLIKHLTHFIKKNSEKWSPTAIVRYCLTQKLPAIAFTYNEPTIFAEYAADTMKLGKKYGLRGVFVSSGFESKEALDYLADYIDAYNIDLKGGSEEFYQKICHSRLSAVLTTIEEVFRRKKWLEVTTLLIPGLNTAAWDLRWIARFLVRLSPDIPWHVSAFYPTYKMADRPATTIKELVRAYEIGRQEGLRFVYTGNIPQRATESTFCPECGARLVERFGYAVKIKELDLASGRCRRCDRLIAGVWN